jgi:hypothetical protein
MRWNSRASSLRAGRERGADLPDVHLAQDLADQLPLAGGRAVRRDPPGEVDRVAQLLGERQRRQVGLGQRHQLVAEVLQVLGVALALALAGGLVELGFFVARRHGPS